MQIDYEKVGKRIAEERKFIRHVSQEKMAEDLGMYQADISNLEHARKGSGITDLSKLQMIADYLGIPLEALLFGSSTDPHLVKYDSSMEIDAKAGPDSVKNNVHKKVLSVLTDPSAIKSCARYTCGPYTTYALIETQMQVKGQDEDGNLVGPRLVRWHFYTFFNDTVVANLVAASAIVFQLVHFQEAEWLSTIIPPDILDPLDARRTLNPYIIFWMLEEDEKEKEKYLDLMTGRMTTLLQNAANTPVAFVESVYVSEDARQHGICRMLFDLLHRMNDGNIILWVNMEPTGGEELFSGYRYFPTYTEADISQITINAAIAEKLGLTVDPDLWHREEAVTDHDGKTHTETVGIRKCAYWLPQPIREIIKDDGDLVALGRAKQELYYEKHKDDPDSVVKGRPEIMTVTV